MKKTITEKMLEQLNKQNEVIKEIAEIINRWQVTQKEILDDWQAYEDKIKKGE